MTRKEFLSICGLLGIGIPLMQGCRTRQKEGVLPANAKVIVIGAGAAGLSAAYLLKQGGIDVQILEASSRLGGRMLRSKSFADFPLALGAEWLHAKNTVLNEIVNDASVALDFATTPYDFDVDKALLEGEEVNLKSLGFSIDQKFINYSWMDFYEEYIVPAIEHDIELEKVVRSIDYSGKKIVVKTGEEEFMADKVILTIPVKLLQTKAIDFTPALPSKKRKAIKAIKVWDGCKAFLEFSEKFYPTVTGFKLRPATSGHKLYYDAAYGQNSSRHFLGLVAVGEAATPYLLERGTPLVELMLEELDALFDGQATKYYRKHIFMDWSSNPFSQGAYVRDDEDHRNIRKLQEPVNGHLYFAGDAYTNGRDWSSVDAAARSAKQAVEALMG